MSFNVEHLNFSFYVTKVLPWIQFEKFTKYEVSSFTIYYFTSGCNFPLRWKFNFFSFVYIFHESVINNPKRCQSFFFFPFTFLSNLINFFVCKKKFDVCFKPHAFSLLREPYLFKMGIFSSFHLIFCFIENICWQFIFLHDALYTLNGNLPRR